MNLKLIVLVFFIAIGSSTAQSKKWTLEECVAYAVEHNLSIEQFELDLENAKIDRSDALGALMPNVNSSISTSGNTGLSFDPTTNQPVTTTILTANGGVTSSLTLFDGLRNFNRLNRAKMNAIANQYRLDDLKDDIRLNVANAYLQILSNKETLKVLRAQYAVTEQDLKRTKELIQAGALPEGDLLEIEATAAGLEQQIVNTENLVLISRINLAQLLQITDYENFDVVDVDYEVPPSDILNKNPKEIFAESLTFRNDIKFSESNIDLAKEDLKITKGALYPTLSAFFNYNTRYSDQGGFDSSTGTFVPAESFGNQLWINDGISYGAQLNIPVFNGFSTRNNIKRAEITVKKAELQLEQDKLDLETNINQAYVDVTSFAKAYEAAQKTLEARQLAYNYSKERYDVGLMNAFDFSQAQSRVDNAAAEVVRTKYDYIFRIKVLEFYFGLPIDLE
ncbi:TolC family protein [Euzebyella marina]|uniref:TolC family protein n=1 Tax=Euzebyella marina TaxID=1761453 RepID=A0A3G2L2X3_9FLAO|nr:TolC family protein [Euzebyella marina]AYN66605.1 TolC family protein [Euzebyella marina]MBG47458.1 transporter [Pseudozobellia sp.]|tara:strand:+ start:2126 stop:3478 length:1353 start_codon:yes stop_codon:yes gene_type:complete